MTQEPLKAPFPYFGGKSAIASLVWERFGDTPNFIEPFAGSLAVLLARPHAPQTETVNDLDGMIANFWRAVRADPDAVAHHADWPVNENDLHARHIWLVNRKGDLQARLDGDPDYHDAKIAGWWVWGICAWIGSGWCSGRGPWTSVDGKLTHLGNAGQGINRKRTHLGNAGRGINRQLTHLGNAGQGINRQLTHLGNAGQGINRQLTHLGDAGRGINRQLTHLGDAGRGQCAEWSEHLRAMMVALSDRLRRVRVCSGDWSRVCGPSPTTKHGLTAVFLDPPYAFAERTGDLYSHDTDVAAAVRAWAVAHGDDPLLRIALCGYEGEHDLPATWTAVPWKARGGYGSQGAGLGRANASREVIWFSPACLRPERRQPLLWGDAALPLPLPPSD